MGNCLFFVCFPTQQKQESGEEEKIIKLSTIGVTPKKQKQFDSKRIYDIESLLHYLPYKYKDFTAETGILPDNETSCFTVRVESVSAYYNKIPLLMALCVIQSTGQKVTLKWFNQSFLKDKLNNCINQLAYVAGKVKYDAQYENYSINSPDVFETNISKGKAVQPVYSKIRGMSAQYLTSKISDATDIAVALADSYPYEIAKSQGLLTKREALYKLHFPKTMKDVERGRERILFDDLLLYALKNEWASRNSAIGSPFSVKTCKHILAVKKSLPYKLTEDQVKAVDDMITHAKEGKRINALIQGDVGCGKSIVAFLLIISMADSGYQSVLMAPTQILAQQHYEEIKSIAEPLGYSVVYLGGKEMKAAEKKAALGDIADGTAHIIVGTHSVIGKGVKYHRLALTIVDEEHKFGVAQRRALVKKAADGVHSVTMSATPIPRSLAQVVYGANVQLHTIKTMPQGRKPILTGIAISKEKLFRFMINQAQKGYQTYVVCPMIEQSNDMSGVKSVEEIYEEYLNVFEPHGICLAKLTGKTKKAETQEVVTRFKNGEIDILISTTVIEVGIDIPTATMMVINNAERFGLSALHQLRGRVGRGEAQSFCVLLSDTQTPEGMQRLEAMVNTTDGFKIAETDLKIRGAGDFLGTKQSGDDKYMNLMLAYPEKYKEAQEIARKMLDDDMECPLLATVKDKDDEC